MLELIFAAYTYIVAWMGGHQLITYLLFSMFMDLLTGLAAAAKERKINSSIATNGWIIKTAVILAVCFAWGIEPLIDSRVGDIPLGETVTLGFIASESISVIENLGRAGVKMPTWFLNVFQKLKSDSGVAEKSTDKA